MRHFLTIFRYELRMLFISPSTYVAGTVFLCIMGGIYWFALQQATMQNGETLLPVESYFFVFWVPLFILVPLITMRSFAEERRAGTLGALVGALVNYWIALFFGRPLVNRFAESRLGSLCLIDREKVEKSEAFFRKYGVVSTFFGRLVPVVRQLISIPAGIARMRMLPFMVFTSLGAAIWNVVLAVVGVAAHGQQDAINEYSRELSWTILVCAALFGAFLIYRFWRGGRKSNEVK